MLQLLATGRLVPAAPALIGAAIVLIIYALLGRLFCSWVCPVNLVTDLAGALRTRLGLRAPMRMSRATRYWVMLMGLAISPLVGVAAFEWVSPIGMLHRELIFGIGLGLLGAVAILLLDLTAVRNGWCGRMCPLGAFYALVARAARFRVAFGAAACDMCMDCVKVCHEPQVLDFDKMKKVGWVAAGECTNCLRCVEECHGDALIPAFRLSWKKTGDHFTRRSR